ncbi:MAG: hypothetical protein D4R65_05745 [Verrucomicrobiaceae bacterium]|nr:MAG: hypothetical protein D4R65_05745 [Verrucomicrobiaceae bacterium]
MIRMLPLFPVVLLLAFSCVADADVDTAHHKAVYAQVNDNGDSFQKVTASASDESGRISLTGWLDGVEVRKIVAKPGCMGKGIDEYYLENGKPLFVFSTYEKTGKKVEERIYFDEGRIVKWLTTDKAAPVIHGEDFESQAGYLNAHCTDFVDALKSKGTGTAAKEAQSVDGVFLGIEQGDYAHWNMRATDGREISLFILRPGNSVSKVLDNPEAFAGRKCRVAWKQSTENIPEAGGNLQVEQILDVEWTGR